MVIRLTKIVSPKKARVRRTPDALKVRLVSEARQTFGTRSAAQLWMRLGLPMVPAMQPPPRQGELFGADPEVS
jgi:hypothetical protein